jgi:hypothetical protein
MTTPADNRRAAEFNLRITTALRLIGLIPNNVNAQVLQAVNTTQNGEPVAILTCRLNKIDDPIQHTTMDVQNVPGKPRGLTVLEGGRSMSRTKRKKLKARRKVEEDK